MDFHPIQTQLNKPPALEVVGVLAFIAAELAGEGFAGGEGDDEIAVPDGVVDDPGEVIAGRDAAAAFVPVVLPGVMAFLQQCVIQGIHECGMIVMPVADEYLHVLGLLCF